MKKTALKIATALLAAGSLQAATVTYTNASVMANDADTTIGLSKFDVALGTLTGVYIEYKTLISGVSVAVDNDSSSQQTGTARVQNLVNHFSVANSVLTPSFGSAVNLGELQISASQAFVLQQTLGDPLGFTATGGPDYAIWTPGTISATSGGDLNSLVFFQYQGTGSFNATIHSIFSTTATFNGADGYFQGNTPSGAFDGKVIYTYSQIPEPATATLSVLVLIVGFWIRRRFID